MTPIRLNVYRLTGSFAVPGLCGCCAAYHTGVQIDATEYTFSQGTGIVASDFDLVRNGPHTRVSVFGESPGLSDEEPEDAVFVYSLDMGVCPMNRTQIAATIESLRREFAGENYHILERNCNHFSDALCRRLVGKGIPAYLNRAAWLGRWISCFFPPGALEPHVSEPPASCATGLELFEGPGRRLGGDTCACSHSLLVCSPQQAPALSGVLRRLTEQWSQGDGCLSDQRSSQNVFIPAEDARALEFSRALLADAARARMERQKGR
ncbi:conserved hypothetical protein [Neospora caninum Liverpool]|uniref:EREBP-4 family protein n=1 Tax=Neospora caninum (strain Liverpool) TaxID=572307 RepID=F0VNZ2_NEOCL|nr:conserved hypothetical protein [Neospora caninum Liverpool]CBZ55438.1 conserved hypothetical protein [Neospora caninum Liverpool]CEL70174.1 TPA: EREBP-4 family protein [Neospora caninum Liverpool]|eukprot:XP_003885466.1 conserved hypothetical protein [Neospora caninum Liverpool]